MTEAKSFDVLDCECSNVSHRHGCFQPIVGWGTMLVEPFDVVISIGHLAEWSSCAVWHHDAVKLMTIMHDLLKTERWNHTNYGSITWMNGMVIALALPSWAWYEFLGGDGQNLLLAAMPGFWRGNGWFGVNYWTPTSTKILLESSFQWLSIGVIKTWWF